MMSGDQSRQGEGSNLDLNREIKAAFEQAVQHVSGLQEEAAKTYVAGQAEQVVNIPAFNPFSTTKREVGELLSSESKNLPPEMVNNLQALWFQCTDDNLSTFYDGIQSLRAAGQALAQREHVSKRPAQDSAPVGSPPEQSLPSRDESTRSVTPEISRQPAMSQAPSPEPQRRRSASQTISRQPQPQPQPQQRQRQRATSQSIPPRTTAQPHPSGTSAQGTRITSETRQSLTPALNRVQSREPERTCTTEPNQTPEKFKEYCQKLASKFGVQYNDNQVTEAEGKKVFKMPHQETTVEYMPNRSIVTTLPRDDAKFNAELSKVVSALIDSNMKHFQIKGENKTKVEAITKEILKQCEDKGIEPSIAFDSASETRLREHGYNGKDDFIQKMRDELARNRPTVPSRGTPQSP